MDPTSFLEATTEVAIAFAGFISIFLVLARRDGSFASEDALAIRVILLSSVGGLFYAAFPLVLIQMNVPDGLLWRLSSAVSLAGLLSALVYVVRIRRGLSAKLHLNTAVRIAQTLNGLSLAAHVSNLVGWPFTPNAGLFLAAVWLTLGISAVNFIGLVFQRVLDEPAA